jgi:ATP-dependent Zn protease
MDEQPAPSEAQLRQARAVHEAGHAVVALALHGQVTSLDIRQAEGRHGARGGQCQATFDVPRRLLRRRPDDVLGAEWRRYGEARARYQLVLTMAGAAATDLAYGRGPGAPKGYGIAGDIAEAMEVARSLSDDPDQELQRAYSRACRLLQARRSQVLAIARALVRDDQLDGDRIEALYRGAVA